MNEFTIQDLITKEVSNREEKEIKSWHASGLGSCVTGRYLERIGVKPDEDFDDRTLRVFSVGKQMEDWIVGLVEKTGVKCEKQVRCELPELDLTGYADLVIENNGKKLVYELKTQHSRSFWYMKDEKTAKEHHIMQVWCYLEALRIDEARIVYISKDDLALQEYVVKRDDPISGKIKSELRMLNECLKRKLPPVPNPDKKWWGNVYCRFHNSCVSQPKYI